VVEARGLLAAGRADEALVLAQGAAKVGRDLAEPNLEVLGRLTVGQVLLQRGRTDEALACLDEVMLTVSRAQLDPPTTGLAYCAVISACMGLLDVPRAREWTGVLSDWCDSQDGLVPFRGECLVHRSQLKAMDGDWPAALEEAQRACDRLDRTSSGNAWYQLGEVHRLRGTWEEAEDAYRRANSLGRQPEPGLALMRLAQGRTDAAATTFRRLYAEPDRVDRLDVLAGYVDAMLAAGDLDAAQAAADELAVTSDAGPLVHRGLAQEARGAVLLARGDAAGALACLRAACEIWYSLALPYDVARVRVRIGDACGALGDDASAALEHDAARETFTRLGARPDLERLDGTASPRGGLTAREVEVLRLVAAGHTNRLIARELVLSEKTVARHLSNIYGKLGIGSRAAATAYAYDHRLV
jgi:DNA-binding NarL/FixJ family response regulator